MAESSYHTGMAGAKTVVLPRKGSLRSLTEQNRLLSHPGFIPLSFVVDEDPYGFYQELRDMMAEAGGEAACSDTFDDAYLANKSVFFAGSPTAHREDGGDTKDAPLLPYAAVGRMHEIRGALSNDEQLRFFDWVSKGGILIASLYENEKHRSWTFQFGVALGEFRKRVGSPIVRRSNTSQHDLLTGVYEMYFSSNYSKYSSTFTRGPAEVGISLACAIVPETFWADENQYHTITFCRFTEGIDSVIDTSSPNTTAFVSGTKLPPHARADVHCSRLPRLCEHGHEKLQIPGHLF